MPLLPPHAAPAGWRSGRDTLLRHRLLPCPADAGDGDELGAHPTRPPSSAPATMWAACHHGSWFTPPVPTSLDVRRAHVARTRSPIVSPPPPGTPPRRPACCRPDLSPHERAAVAEHLANTTRGREAGSPSHRDRGPERDMPRLPGARPQASGRSHDDPTRRLKQAGQKQGGGRGRPTAKKAAPKRGKPRRRS